MRKLFYMGLESYVARYTYQLENWNKMVFNKRDIDYVIVNGQRISDSEEIKTGSVLDAHGRSFYSLTQCAEMVRLMGAGEVTSEDVIFFEDMFTPGIESLAYVIDQVQADKRPRVFVRCLAQSVDPDDFVNREGMHTWMRKYEEMVADLCTKTNGGILVASEELVANLRISGFTCPIFVTGLPYNKEEVLQYTPEVSWLDKENRVCFAARWDDEKQPEFFLALAESMYATDPTVEFAILTGHKTLKSNNPSHLAALEAAKKKFNVKVYEGMSKKGYYEMLARSKVLFNCALQDWVSNTVSEADTYGAMTIYPAYRSFPEVFANNEDHMYLPWSINSAKEKILKAINRDTPFASIGLPSDWQGGTIDRTLDVFLGLGEQWRRDTLDYRKHVSAPKY